MEHRRIAVIMAGGSGERFWPVSTKQRPKQFLRLTSPEKSLLQEAVDRAVSLFGRDATFVATGEPLAEQSAAECRTIDFSNVLAEPAKRNTTGCLVWVAANMMADHPQDWRGIAMAVLTADHRISPEDAFHRTVATALQTAEDTDGLVTIGIPPTRPETGYGYIELGDPAGKACVARSFREKPSMETAQEYVASGHYLWNSGMFFWTLGGFIRELEEAQPEIAATTLRLAGLIGAGEAQQAREAFEGLPGISIDFALMERAKVVFVVRAEFDWDDLGSWDSLRRSYEPDSDGNVAYGAARIVESSDMVVYNETFDQEVCALGLEDLVIVVTSSKVMVCPANKAQEVRKFSAHDSG